MNKHAYMIIAHNQFELLEKLILALDDERSDIYVHIDAKVKDFDFEHFGALTKHSRLSFTDERVNITWGDFSQVECEMVLLHSAVSGEDADNPYTYYHLISGVDLPIKSNDDRYEFFESSSGREFIHYTSNEVQPSSVSRIRYYHLFRKKRNLFRKILAQIALKAQVILGVDRLKGKDIRVQKGCNWFSITGELAKYIVSHQEKYKSIFSYSYCCDELFIQTIVESSDFKNNLFMPCCNNDHFACVRLIDWERGNPYIWRSEDFDLLKTSPCMFARKFDLNTDREIIERVLNELN